MEQTHLKVFRLFSAVVGGTLGLAVAQAQPAAFTGSYTENFDELGTSGTTLPAGFGSMAIAGGNSTYSAASPISASGIASATPGTQSLIVWNAGHAVQSSGSQLFNIGCFDSLNDRALGTDPTGTAANIIQLALVNNTGGTLYGVTVSYSCKCLTNGSSGTEQSELPGYCFFYSTTTTNSGASWTEVGTPGSSANKLCLPNYTQGTTMNSGAVNITFATPLASGGVMYFRWADDNNVASSPDQQLAIDDISIATYTPNSLAVSLGAPANNASFTAPATIPLSATVSDTAGTVTNVAFYQGTSWVTNVTSAPFSSSWQNVGIGSYSLTAVAKDNAGLTVTSAVVTVSVASPVAVSITSPANNAGFISGSTVTLQASATDASGRVTNVSYYANTTPVGSATTAPYTVNWVNAGAGSYALTAVAMDNAGYTATSAVVSVSSVNPAVGSFTGLYAENFDLDLSNSTTLLPPGFTAWGLTGDHFLFTNGAPITSAAVGAATAGVAALTVWNAGAAVARGGSTLFNAGCWDSLNNRALGTDPTGNAGTVIQLALTNNTGGGLPGVTFSYTERCLTNGSTSNGSYTDDGTERLELPGYSFFYSLTGSTNAADWYRVDALNLTNWVQGTASDSGPVNIAFPTPLASGGVMYFRWADDNCVASSPDQMYAIDNISIATYNAAGPLISFNSPTNNQNIIPGTAFALSLNTSDSGGNITNVTLYVGSSPVYTFTSGPYELTVPGGELPPGGYALSAVATDDAGLSATSAVVNLTIAYVAPAVALTSPANSASYAAPASIPLTATASSTDGTITNVAFYQGTALLANVTASPYNYTWANVLAGSYSLTAVATDSHGLLATSGVVLATVTNGYATPVVVLTSPANNAAYLPGANVFLAATASESAGTITNVEFFAGGAALGGAASLPYNLTWANVPVGNYALTAVAMDGAGNTSTSSVVNISVANAPAAPAISLASPANNAALDVAGGLNLTASVTAGSSAVTNVAFYLNGFINVANVSAPPFRCAWTNAPTGLYTLTAIAQDSQGLSATSSVVSVTASNSVALATLKQIKTFFIIPLENHDFVQQSPTTSPQQLLNNPACPYFNSLITPGNANAVQVSYATHYFSTSIAGEHPSEPNYIWNEAGTDFGVRTDNDPSTASGNQYSGVQHLSGQLTAAGVSWKDYQEDVEYSSSEEASASGSGGKVNAFNGTTQYSYAVKHNPMAFFTDTQNKNCYPLTNFWNDLLNNNVGRYNWITPDQYNEMHSSLSSYTYHGTAYTGDQAAIAEGDNFLSIAIPKIMASAAYQDHGAIIIWTDETESTDDTNTTLPFVIISPLAKGNAYASMLAYSHPSDLKTMDEIFGLAFQNNAIPADRVAAQNAGYNYVDGHSAVINDFADFFKTVPAATLASAENPSGYKDNVTFTATILGSSPSGSVQFATNGVAFGSAVSLAGGAASAATAVLPRGNTVVSAAYSGDNFNQPATASLTQTATNHPPAAGNVYYPHTPGVSQLIGISVLLTNVADVDGDPVTLAGVGADGFNLLSTNGASLFNNGSFILYTNSVTANVNDSFQYTVTDGFGGTGQGTIFLVTSNNALGQGNVRLQAGPASITANFFGLPGFRYIVQRSTNLVSGSGWVSIATNTAPATGLLQVQDNFQDLGLPVPPVPSPVYYRLEYRP